MENSVTSSPCLLVRVQDGLHGMRVDESGNLILKRDSTVKRNTVHFAVNGVVSNHVYGTFDGQIAIIADVTQMGVPSGFRFEDTWFHADANGELNVGKAVLIAPIGTELPVGARANYFDPAQPDARNLAVNDYLKSQKITSNQFNMNGIEGVPLNEYFERRSSVVQVLYGDHAKKITADMHTNSLDGELESRVGACEHHVAAARTTFLFCDDNRIDVEYTDYIAERLSNAHTLIATFKSSVPPSVASDAAGYLDKISRRLDELAVENESIRKKFESPLYLENGVGPFAWDDVERKIQRGLIHPQTGILDIRKSNAGLVTAEEMFSAYITLPTAEMPAVPPPLPPPHNPSMRKPVIAATVNAINSPPGDSQPAARILSFR